MPEGFQNFASTTLTSQVIANGITVIVADAAPFAALMEWVDGSSPSSYSPHLRIVFEGPDGNGGTAREVAMAYAKRTNLSRLQIESGKRGLEGTTARQWPIGTKVYAALTAAQCAPLAAAFIAAAKSGSSYVFTRPDGTTVTV